MQKEKQPEQAIYRVEQMELSFDALRAALGSDPRAIREDAALRGMLLDLIRYYESGQWLEDYERDEQGLLPPWLKRGVLSQDGLYNLLCEISGDET